METKERLISTAAELKEKQKEWQAEQAGRFEELTGFSLEELREKAGLRLRLEDLADLKDLAELHLDALKGKTDVIRIPKRLASSIGTGIAAIVTSALFALW